MTTSTTADIAAELDALPAQLAAARTALDPTEVLRLENRQAQLQQDLHQARGRELSQRCSLAWEAALPLMDAATTAEAVYATAETAAEKARRTVLLYPGDSNEQRAATYAAYSAAATRAEACNQAHRAAREEATRALVDVDDAVAALEAHTGAPVHDYELPTTGRRLVASVVVGDATVGAAADAFPPDAFGARSRALEAGTVVPRAIAYRLGAHVLSPAVEPA